MNKNIKEIFIKAGILCLAIGSGTIAHFINKKSDQKATIESLKELKEQGEQPPTAISYPTQINATSAPVKMVADTVKQAQK